MKIDNVFAELKRRNGEIPEVKSLCSLTENQLSGNLGSDENDPRPA